MSSKATIGRVYVWCSKKVHKHPIIITLLLIVIYLVIFQRDFITSSDVWAEGYSEYLAKSVSKSFFGAMAPSWEGYLTLIPSLLAKMYVHFFGGYLGYVGYYYRAVVILFTVASVIFIAAPINRKLIKNDYVRIVFSLATLFLLSHVSSFSFINVWYICFVPIILISLNTAKLSNKQQIWYVLLSLLAAFTKPSLILVPFVAYRAVKTKEYVSNGIILLAAFIQTYLTLFRTSDTRVVTLGIKQLFLAIYLGNGVAPLKILHVHPNQLYVLVANLAVLGLFVLLLKKRGVLFTAVIAVGYLFSIYTNLLAPGTQTDFHALAIYNDIYKLQRELMTNFFVLLLVFLNFETMHTYVRSYRKQRMYTVPIFLAIASLGFLNLYQHIDTTS